MPVRSDPLVLLFLVILLALTMLLLLLLLAIELRDVLEDDRLRFSLELVVVVLPPTKHSVEEFGNHLKTQGKQQVSELLILSSAEKRFK